MRLNINVRLFADGASIDEMRQVSSVVQGFTTNPSLMLKAGITSYRAFAEQVLSIAEGRPVSFEVLSDDFAEMHAQAWEIHSWGNGVTDNIFVKIPITNSKGESSSTLIKALVERGLKVNVTAVMHRLQVEAAVAALSPAVPSFISIFAGRLADTGTDVVPFMTAMSSYVHRSRSGLIWASTREIYNVVQASECGVGFITLTPSLLARLPLLGKDALEYSLETVQEFARDGQHLAWG